MHSSRISLSHVNQSESMTFIIFFLNSHVSNREQAGLWGSFKRALLKDSSILKIALLSIRKPFRRLRCHKLFNRYWLPVSLFYWRLTPHRISKCKLVQCIRAQPSFSVTNFLHNYWHAKTMQLIIPDRNKLLLCALLSSSTFILISLCKQNVGASSSMNVDDNVLETKAGPQLLGNQGLNIKKNWTIGLRKGPLSKKVKMAHKSEISHKSESWCLKASFLTIKGSKLRTFGNDPFW